MDWQPVADAIVCLLNGSGMVYKKIAGALLVLLLNACANIPESSDFPRGGPAAAPAGWTAYCKRNGEDAQCLKVSGTTWRLLDHINWRVNATPYMSDLEKFGGPYWDASGQDCEDFALRKRNELAAAGVPLQAMGIATAYTEKGVRHAVLAVHTDRGVFVLDNRYSTVQAWADMPYRWQSYFDPLTNTWSRIAAAEQTGP